MSHSISKPFIRSDDTMSPIFVGGTGRSGTTILKRVLSCHSKVVSLRDELSVIVHPDGALDLVNTLSERWSPYTADIAIRRFRDLMLANAGAKSRVSIYLHKAIKVFFRKLGASPPRYMGASLSYSFGDNNYRQYLEQLLSELCYHATRGSWAGSPGLEIVSKIYESGPYKKQDIARRVANFFNDLYKIVAIEGENYWLDDTPSNILRANELLEVFPKLRMLHMYRDPRDVLSSYRRFSWGGDNDLSIARRLASIYQRWLDIRNQFPKEFYLEIGLEALSENPEARLREICSLLDLDFEKCLLKIPLNKVHAGRWKHELAKKNMDEIENILSPYINAYGYDL